MTLHEHELHQRWRLWMELRATADRLQALANNWAQADSQLRHYLWMLQQTDEESPPPPTGRIAPR